MQAQSEAKKNARLVILTSFLTNSSFIIPIWLLYSVNELRLSPALSVSLFMSLWFVSALLEIPTGALADRLGRRKVFVLGNLLLAIFPLAYAFKLPTLVIFAGNLIGALGYALQSGALIPLVHASYNKAGLSRKAYNNFLSNNQMSVFVARIVSGITGAALYSKSVTWPFLALSVVYLLQVMAAIFISDHIIPAKDSTSMVHIKATLTEIKKRQLIVAAMVVYVSFNFVAEAVWTGYQIFYEADGRSTVVIGTLFTAIAVCSTVGAFAIRYLIDRFKPLRLLQFFGLGILLTSFLLMQPNLALRLLAVVPMGFFSGITLVTLKSTVQHQIDNKFHSTALSVISLITSAVYGIASLAIGLSFQLLGVGQTRTILFTSSTLIFVIMSLYVTNNQNLSPTSL